MASKLYNLLQLLLYNTAAQWMLLNPVLLPNEVGFESDTGLFKIGDGSTPWSQLPYSRSSSNVIYAGSGIIIDNNNISTTLLYTIIDTEVRYNE